MFTGNSLALEAENMDWKLATAINSKLDPHTPCIVIEWDGTTCLVLLSGQWFNHGL